MKLRHALAFTIFPVVVVLAILQGGALLTRSYMDEASLQAGSALRLAVAALAGHLSRYEPLPALIADHADIEGLLQAPESASLRRVANKYLKEINDLLKSSDIYVMTPDGNTVAASNYDQPGTFIGENFSYRPYFQDAIAGHPARFYALGTTSLKRGYYFSSPVIVARKILGVIVFKVDIESIEASWRGGEYKIFVADPEGIVFMSGSPEWLYTGILPLDAPRLARTQASRRYAEAVLKPLRATESVYHGQHLMRIAGEGTAREYLRLSHYMPEADWTVNVLLDTASVRTQARTALIAVLLFICLAGLGVAVLASSIAIAFGFDSSVLTRLSAPTTAAIEQRLIDLASPDMPELVTTAQAQPAAKPLFGAKQWLDRETITAESVMSGRGNMTKQAGV